MSLVVKRMSGRQLRRRYTWWMRWRFMRLLIGLDQKRLKYPRIDMLNGILYITIIARNGNCRASLGPTVMIQTNHLRGHATRTRLLSARESELRSRWVLESV